MPPPLRRVVIFKGGGYIYSAMEDMIADNRLGHVMRLTNLIRKAHCVLCKPTWDDGRKIHLREHQVAAEKRGVPFLLIDSLSAVAVVEVLRPLLIKRKIVRGSIMAPQTPADDELHTTFS